MTKTNEPTPPGPREPATPTDSTSQGGAALLEGWSEDWLPSSWALDEVTWKEAERIISAAPRMILPVGSLDQHGPHLPLGSHTYIVSRLAQDLSEGTGTLRAPAIPYGVNEPASHAYEGTASLRRKTLHRAVNEIIAALEDHGVRNFLILTAHRFEPHVDALLMALTTQAVTSVVDLSAIDISDLVQDSPTREHAGEAETSLLLYLDPGRVRADEIRDRPLQGSREYRKYVRGRQPTPPAGSDGVVGYPSRATAEKGRLIYDRYLDTCRSILMEINGEG